MSDLAVLAVMAEDLALRARIGVLLGRVALDVLAEAPVGEDAPLADRLVFERRHQYARTVLADPFGLPARQAQAAAVAWRGSGLAATYVQSGPAGPSDNDLEYTLLQVWGALAGS